MNLQDILKTFYTIWKVSRQTKNFPDLHELIQISRKSSRKKIDFLDKLRSAKNITTFQDELKNFRKCILKFVAVGCKYVLCAKFCQLAIITTHKVFLSLSLIMSLDVIFYTTNVLES